jgi:hypothetical protein
LTNQYPYPAIEHLEPALSPYDVIGEELRYYPTGKEFRAGIIAISKIYDKTPLMIGFKKYARLLNIAQLTTDVTSELERPVMAANFYSGEVFATHTAVQPMPKPIRQYVLGQDYLSQYAPGVTNIDPGNSLLKLACAELLDFRDSDWQDLFNRQDDLYQGKLLDAAARLYEDVPNPGHNEDDFMAGYLYAANLIFLAVTKDD